MPLPAAFRFASAHESEFGTSRTSRDVRLESAKWAKADLGSGRWGGAHPQARRAMKTVAMIFTLALVGSQALAQEQTRIYGPAGRSLGTAALYGTGSVRYRDSGGHLTATVIGSRRR